MAEIAVRATINLPGLTADAEAIVDDEDPYMANCIKQGYLVSTVPATTTKSSRASSEPRDGRDSP